MLRQANLWEDFGARVGGRSRPQEGQGRCRLEPHR